MKRRSLFLRFLSATLAAGVLVAAFFLTGKAIWNLDDNGTPLRMRGTRIAQMLSPLPPEEQVFRLETLKDRMMGPRAGDRVLDFEFWLVEEDGTVAAATSEKPLPVSWDGLPLPEWPGGAIERDGRGWGCKIGVLRLGGLLDRFLVIEARVHPPGLALNLARRLVGYLLPVSLTILFAAVLGLWFFRRKARLAREVLGALQRGDLTARFPVSRLDEVSQLWLRFNEMAEEIERLVRRLRDTEAARTRLLRELAHDVRTPLTALRHLVETVLHRGREMPEDMRQESLKLALGELDYFERLIEDLFLLAQAEEPGYRPEVVKVEIKPLLEEEAARAAQVLEDEKRIEVACPEGLHLEADPYLLRRLLRNALQNARRHCRASIELSAETGPEGIRITVRDDGPGFTEESLAHFGRRRSTRLLDSSAGEQLSLGLGSLIMDTIVRLHGGRLEPGNWEGGGQVRVHFPAAAASRAAA